MRRKFGKIVTVSVIMLLLAVQMVSAFISAPIENVASNIRSVDQNSTCPCCSDEEVCTCNHARPADNCSSRCSRTTISIDQYNLFKNKYSEILPVGEDTRIDTSVNELNSQTSLNSIYRPPRDS